MKELEKRLKEIEELRAHLLRLIEAKSNLTDPQILEKSKMLDACLNEYNILAKEKEMVIPTK